MNYFLVAAGAAVGAPMRYLVDRYLQRRLGSAFPWGTIAVNVAGSFVLGVVVGFGPAPADPLLALIGTGFCGALTTYSTFSYETWDLVERRRAGAAAVNVVGSVALGLGAATVGYLVSSRALQ